MEIWFHPLRRAQDYATLKPNSNRSAQHKVLQNVLRGHLRPVSLSALDLLQPPLANAIEGEGTVQAFDGYAHAGRQAPQLLRRRPCGGNRCRSVYRAACQLPLLCVQWVSLWSAVLVVAALRNYVVSRLGCLPPV